MIVDIIYPQEYHIVSYPKASSPAPVPATITSSVGQPSREALAEHDIKVRDFAYESTLPPIAAFRIRQVQATPNRPMKRARQSEDEEDAESSSNPTNRLERTVTEPVVDDSLATTRTRVRARGIANINLYDPFIDDPNVQTHLVNSQQSNPDTDTLSQSQPSLQYLTSQESDNEPELAEPYIRTPIVTPNGSLRWETSTAPIIDNSSLPASQLDTSSQAQDTAPELLSYSQLGFSQIEDEMETQMETDAPMHEHPSTPLPSLTSSSPLPRAASSSRRIPSQVPDVSPSPRYHLRKRPPPQPQPPPRTRSRPQSSSMQSAHSSSKTRSLRSKVIRKADESKITR